MGIQQPHPNLPDILVGLGGAGKKVVHALLDQEWVAESIAAAGAAGGLPAFYLVDAETDRLQEDYEVVDAITQRLEEAIHRRDGEIQGEVGDIISVLNLGEYIDGEDIFPRDLVAEVMVERIVRETDVETWWLNEDDYAYPDEGLHHGTRRRRSLAKALPPASRALTSGDPLNQIGPEGPGVNAVLVAGLGGGFGSGIALDLARRMDEAGTDVTLFSILPGDGFGDGEHERANAHAALSELEYLALTDDNPFENVILVPTPDDLSDFQAFDEAIAYAVLAHSNLQPNDRMTLDETQAAGPDRYAPFTVVLPQMLRFDVKTVEGVLAETADWLHERQHRLNVELDLYRELSDLVIEAFPEASGPVDAYDGDGAAGPAEAPAEPIDDSFDLPVEEAEHLLWRIDNLLETLEGDIFEILDNHVAFDWLHAIEQVRENARADAGGEDSNDELANLVTSLRHLLLNNPVQGEPNDFRCGQDLHDTVRMELKAVVLRSRLLRAAHQIEDAVYREGVLTAVDEDQRHLAHQDLRARLDELSQILQDQRERMEAFERLRHEVGERVDHRIAMFREEAQDAIETLVLISRHRQRIDELLDHIKDQLRDFVAQVEHAAREVELPEDPLDADLLDELNGLLGELGIDPIDWKRLLESARAVVEAKAAWLDWQGDLLQRVFFDWPERYERAFERTDPELFDIPTADEAEQEFYCRFVGDHIFERPRKMVKERQDQAIDDVIRAAERAVDTTDLDVDDFQVSSEDRADIEGSDIDDTWRTELRTFLSSISASRDPPSPGQVLGELRDPGGIIRESVKETLLTPVDRALNAAQEDVEAIEANLDRTERLEKIVEDQSSEFAWRTGKSRFPAPGTDLDPPHHPEHYVRRVSITVEDPHHHNSLAETDHPDVRVAIEEFLDATVYPFRHLDDRVGLAAGDVVGEGNAGPIPYDGHRVVRAHFGTIFGDDGGDFPTDDALAEVANAVGGGENFVGRHFRFGDPWEVATMTFVGGVFLDNLAPVTAAHGYRSAYGRLRKDLGKQIRIHHAHGLDGRDRSLVESGDDAGFVYRDRVLNVHDHAAIEPIVAADEIDAVEWILKKCVATESFVGNPDSNSSDDAEGTNRS